MLHTKKNERKGASLAVCGTKIPHVCHQKEKKKREKERYWTASKKAKLNWVTEVSR